MNLQYISDSKGETTGVFIPINDWNELKRKYFGLEYESEVEIPDWQKEIVLKRLDEYAKDKTIAINFEDALRDIEKGV